MINAVTNIGGHLTERVLCDNKGVPLTLPSLYPYLYQFRLKIFDNAPDGTPTQVYPDVTALTSSIGLVATEPVAGTFCLRYGTDTPTVPIDFKDTADDFRNKLSAVAGSSTYGLDVVYQPTPSTWVCRFLTPPSDTPIPLNGYNNELEPETFIRVREFTQNAEDWIEVRLLQGPLASTSSVQTILPQAPSVRTIRDGYMQDDGLVIILVDEIQSIDVPPDFPGTYTIRYQARESVALSVNSGPADIATALNNMYGDSVTRFVVTNPEANSAYVEFVGPFAGLDMDPLVVHVTSTGNLDLFFTIDLNTTEVANALRTNNPTNAIFETRVHIVDPTVPDDPGQDVVLFQAPVIIAQPLHWEGLEEAAPIDWLFPPNPKDYIPFTLDQLITGSQSYSQSFGDGILTSYVITHMLNADALSVQVRENMTPGRLLRDDEYSVEFDDTHMALTITILAGPPATNSLLVSILATGDVTAFLNHTHTIDQIIGLRELLDSILARLAALEAVFATLTPPSGSNPFAVDPTATFLQISIDNKANLIPTNRTFAAGAIDLTKLPPPGLLLPAIHTVIELGLFTANPTTDVIVLTVAHPGLVDGQRARIFPTLPIDTFGTLGGCTFTSTESPNDTVHLAGHGLTNGRRVQFSGGQLPNAISTNVIYYVINETINTFQVSTFEGGPVLMLLSDGDAVPHHLLVFPELPGGLKDSVDYYMLAPTSTTFKLSETLDGPVIDITDAGFPTVSMSTIAQSPSTLGALPPPGGFTGQAFNVVEDLFLRGTRGIPSETVHGGDFIASDGRAWYHVTRSDVPGSNSFYPTPMETEIFQFAINDNMLPLGGVLTLTFNLSLQMFRHDTDTQFVAVIEVGDLPEDVTPAPVGPNLYEVIWNPTPVMQQRIIVTDVLILHTFGAQVTHKNDGTLSTNKKQYSVQLSGDAIPVSANFAMRLRLIEFDTEDNVFDAEGLVYYSMDTALAGITGGSPVLPTQAPIP